MRTLRQRLPNPVKKLIRRVTHWTLHSTLGVVIAIVLIFVAAHLWLPTLAERKDEIETNISSAIGNPVTLGKLDTYWDGLNPGVRIQGLSVRMAATGRQAIRLKEMRLSLSWLALLTGRLEINSLVLVEPSLTLAREADGQLRVGGIEAAASDAPVDLDITQLLLSQKELIIENGELVWLDRQSGPEVARRAAVREAPFRVRRVNLDLRNDGDRHRIEFRADFPDNLCKDCRFSADVRGRPLGDKPWHGEIGIQAQALTLQGLPRVAREALPPGLAGRFDLRLTSQWRNDRPQRVEGRVAVTGLLLPLPDEARPLSIPTLDANLHWQGDAQAWQLAMSGLRLGLTRSAWSAGRLRLDVEPDRRRFEIEHVDVADLAGFVAAQPRAHALLDWLRAAQPAGNVNRLRIELAGPMSEPTDYSIDADLRDIRFAARDRVPGVQGLSGQLALTRHKGEFQLDSKELRLALPRAFREPLVLQRLSSRIRWRQNPDDWFVQAQDIVLNAPDGRARGELELRLPKDPGTSPVLKLRATFNDLNGGHTGRYLPLTFSDDLRAWIERAVVSGRVAEGSVVLHGALDNFPFRDGKGRFEVRAHMQDIVLNYLPGWAPLHDVEADFLFDGTSLLITSARSQLRSLELGRLVAAIDDVEAPDGAVVKIDGRVVGPVQEALGVLQDSKLPLFTSLIPTELRAEGDGHLTLSLRIPVRAANSLRIAGLYRPQNSALALPYRGVRATDIQGGVEFSEAGLRSGKLNAHLLGGEAVLEVIPDAGAPGGSRLEAHGTATQAGLAEVLGPGLSPRIGGQVTWQARLLAQRDGSEWRVETNLRELELRLPEPLTKPAGEPLLLQVSVKTTRDIHRTLTLEAGERVSGKLAFQQSASGWTFSRGQIGIGEKIDQVPDAAGLHVSMRWPALNVDDWWPVVRDHLGDSQGSDRSPGVSRVSAELDSVEVFGRSFGRLSLDMGNTAGNWRGRVEGDSIAGEVAVTRPKPVAPALAVDNVPATGRAAIQLTLEHLTLPPAREQDDAQPPAEEIDPHGLPPLKIKSDAFTFEGKALGVLDFSALPEPHGWRIASLKLTRPESNLEASGAWEMDGRGQPRTRVSAALTSTDFGKLMGTLGLSEEIVGGKFSMQSDWTWSGAPTAFQMARADGEFNFVLDDGRIPNISPGAGRVLGALDLRSVTRYLTLDFSNVFAKGLSFDTIKGKVTVESGNAYTRKIAIRTPGASIDLSGRIGLAARDLDLELDVTPHLMEELAITGGILGGPVVGATVALLHSLVKKPFEQGTRIKYTVQGKWDDPAVNRIGPPPTPVNEGQ